LGVLKRHSCLPVAASHKRMPTSDGGYDRLASKILAAARREDIACVGRPGDCPNAGRVTAELPDLAAGVDIP
jgi:hypothetical protein